MAAALFLVAIAVATPADRSGAQALQSGMQNSWIRIQNVGVSPAHVQLDFHDVAGAPVASDGCPSATCETIAPGLGRSFFQEGFEGVAPGYVGSAFLDIDQPFVALLAKDSFRAGGFEIAGDTLRLGGGSPTQYAPVVVNTGTSVSRLAVQNASTQSDACFEIAYFEAGSSVPVALDPATPGRGCPAGGELVAARGTLRRDESNLPVPVGFDGSAVIRAIDTATGVRAISQQPTVTVDTVNRVGAGLASYRTIGGDELSRTVVLPVADRDGSEGQSSWSTRFRITPADPAAGTQVTLLFEGHDGAGGRVEFEHDVHVVGALTCDLRAPGAGGCLPPGEDLPPRFFGTVRMQAIEPIAVVAQRISATGELADYRGFTAEEASRQVVLPVLNRNYGPWGGTSGWNSWFRVLTFDGSVAHVRVVYYSRQFPNGLISDPVVVERERTFRQWEDPSLPDGWVGSAVIVADRPVVVVANLESDVFEGDPVMMYNGVSLE